MGSLYIKINIPTYSRRLPFTEKVLAVADCPGTRPYAVFYETQVIEVEGDETMVTVPLLPSWAAVMEYVVKAATGHPSVPKGGTPEYRNGPQYKNLYGKRQGDRCGKKKKFGYGAYAAKSTRFTTIEQNLSAIRKWLDVALQDTTIANPARNARLEKVRVSAVQYRAVQYSTLQRSAAQCSTV